MDPAISNGLIHVINNCERPGQYNTNSNICIQLIKSTLIQADLFCIKTYLMYIIWDMCLATLFIEYIC